MSRARRSTAAMSEAERDLALERYQQLRPALEDGVPLAQVAQEHQIPLRTAQPGSHSIGPTGSPGSLPIVACTAGSLQSCSA